MNTESIGVKLKKARQEKGLSLEEVRKKTKIHLNILKALEGDSLTNLSPIYLKGFLKIYCNFLGVDPKECDLERKETLPPPVSALSAREEKKTLKTPSFLDNAGERLHSLGAARRLKKIVIFALVIVVSGAVLFKLGKFIFVRPKPAAVFTPPPGLKKPQAKAQTRAAAPLSASQAAAIKVPKESSGGVSLVVSAKENCLILVKVDGRVVLHRVLEKGRSDSWKAKERIELSLGNAAAVELIVNGQRFTKLGRKGQQLKNIVITEKDGLRIPR
jgi:cytoskeletal protein RodZ